MKWKTIPGFANYEVSDTGRVWSNISNRELSQWKHGGGYLCVDLSKDKNRFHKRVHRLVMLAFVGKPPKNKTDVNHKDGNKQNNNLDNLEYCSRSYNIKHRHSALGYKAPRGNRKHILTDKEINEIRQLRGPKREDRKYKYTIRQLAEMFSVCKQTIMCIIYKCGNYKNRGD